MCVVYLHFALCQKSTFFIPYYTQLTNGKNIIAKNVLHVYDTNITSVLHEIYLQKIKKQNNNIVNNYLTFSNKV